MFSCEQTHCCFVRGTIAIDEFKTKSNNVLKLQTIVKDVALANGLIRDKVKTKANRRRSGILIMAIAVSPQFQNTQSRVVVIAGVCVFVLAALALGLGGTTQATAVFIGVLAGFGLYHASFGFTGAWRRVFSEGRGAGLRYQFLLIVVTSAFSFPLIAYTSAQGNILPVSMGMLFGSFVFGVGMQFGGGCGSGTLFTAGGGSTRMMITLAFFITGSVVGTAHFPWWQTIAFPDVVQDMVGAERRFSYGMINRLGPEPAFVVLASTLLAVGLFTVWNEKRLHGSLEKPLPTGSFLRGPWSPLSGAICLAIVGVLSLLVIGRPWGITFGFALWGAKIASGLGVDIASWPYWSGWRANLLEQSVFKHSVSVMNFGIMLGAMAAAGLAAKYTPVWRLTTTQIWTAILGGFLMGYGARLAYGCNIGAYLGGLISGSLHGWAWAVMAFVGSCSAIVIKRKIGI